MFVDYLRLSYLIPWESNTGDKGVHVARDLARRYQLGERKLDRAHRCKVYADLDGTRVVMDWGGSVIPLELTDFCKRFKAYGDWKISRLDLAENIEHLTRTQVRRGQSKVSQDYYHRTPLVGGDARVWTGCTVGKRGTGGSYMRVYDARKHKEGQAAKIARFGSCDFWRLEYELGREYFRRKGIHFFKQLNPEVLGRLWDLELYKKGVDYHETGEYRTFYDLREEDAVCEEIRDANRLKAISRMVRKMQTRNLRAVVSIAVCEGNRRKLDPSQFGLSDAEYAELAEGV